MFLTAGRLGIEWQSLDRLNFYQTHRNGSDIIVGRIELDDDEIEDAIYLLKRIKVLRKREALKT